MDLAYVEWVGFICPGGVAPQRAAQAVDEALERFELLWSQTPARIRWGTDAGTQAAVAAIPPAPPRPAPDPD